MSTAAGGGIQPWTRAPTSSGPWISRGLHQILPTESASFVTTIIVEFVDVAKA